MSVSSASVANSHGLSPPPPPPEAQASVFEPHIHHALANFDYTTALFLADRYAALAPSLPRAAYLHAEVNFAAGLPAPAYALLEAQASYLPAKFLFARVCLELDRLQEAEAALREVVAGVGEGGETVAMDCVWALLGQVCRRAGKKDGARAAFAKALELNPFLWSAYQGYCELGGAPEADEIFAPKNEEKPPSTTPHEIITRSKKRNRNGTKLIDSSQQDTESEISVPKADPTVEATNLFLSDLRMLGSGYRLLMQYECREAIVVYSKLPEPHLRTSWVLMQVARAFYDVGRYPEAVRYFREAHSLEPWRTEGMEFYGSCLWHMREEVELAYLAKEMEAQDRLAPQTWCIVGNLYSVQQEHDLAINAFSRAIQLDPYYHYAHTLIAFEYKMQDECEKAVEYFQRAIRIDPRPYNAWFGLGEVYFKQENFGNSLFMLEKAVEINRMHPIIQFHYGSILQKMNRPALALAAHKNAVSLDRRNPLYRLHLASAYVDFGKYEEALNELQHIDNFTHVESNVYLVMGNAYRKLGDTKNALMAFTKARDHRSTRHDVINQAIERLYEDEEEYEDGAASHVDEG
ncbi:hypothetical protein HDU87_002994 [Geranomyces variabilis]|uniref:Uncharacterized protein n=1 Tax=Geranomyces variabilis TaxID=109894 RepID=A0AAD5XR01_9FUNG|nr:hypothetical protein HDU87_002994 [Geranomyces variabilis]